MRTILSMAVGRVLGELAPLVRAHAGGRREDALAVQRVLRVLFEGNVGPLASILRRPHASTLIRALRSMPPAAADPVVTLLFATLAHDLAWMGELPGEIVLRRLPKRIVSLVSRTVLEVPPDAESLRFRSGRIEVTRAGDGITLDLAAESPWIHRSFEPLEQDIVLALADDNPLSAIDAHPDKRSPNSVSLGDQPVAAWTAGLREALRIIAAGMPELRAEMDLMLQQIVPTGYDAEKHLSSSYQEAIGTIYVSLHPAPMTVAEAIIHEVSHNKINALLETDPIVDNTRDALYASPVRPDARPLHGVLLAVHAFLPVARLYERMLEAGHPLAEAPGFRERFLQIVASNHEGTQVILEHARPTRVGRGLIDEMARWEQHYGRLSTSRPLA
jgi:HEXXH motif-containing protein